MLNLNEGGRADGGPERRVGHYECMSWERSADRAERSGACGGGDYGPVLRGGGRNPHRSSGRSGNVGGGHLRIDLGTTVPRHLSVFS